MTENRRVLILVDSASFRVTFVSPLAQKVSGELALLVRGQPEAERGAPEEMDALRWATGREVICPRVYIRSEVDEMMNLTPTTGILILMLIAVVVIAGRTWWGLRRAEQHRRKRSP
jgi:hypothetical protein